MKNINAELKFQRQETKVCGITHVKDWLCLQSHFMNEALYGVPTHKQSLQEFNVTSGVGKSCITYVIQPKNSFKTAHGNTLWLQQNILKIRVLSAYINYKYNLFIHKIIR
jgi:hypothetical protein